MSLQGAICQRYTLIKDNAVDRNSADFISIPENVIERHFSDIPRSWIVLATVAGCEDAIKKTVFGLSAEQLKLRHKGFWRLPQYLPAAVEAVAAHDPFLLASLSKQWVKPNDIENEFSNIWWRETWVTALRHLKAIEAVKYEDVRHVQDKVLQQEVALLWNDRTPEVFSWHELVQQAREENVLPDLRQHDGDEMVEQVLTVKDIMTGWGPDSSPNVNPYLFRVLRGRAHKLDAQARRGLLELLKNSTNENDWNESMLMELCEEISLDTKEIKRVISQRLAWQVLLTELPNPSLIKWIYFGLLGTWRQP